MNNYKKIVLDNGLTVYLFSDNTKNRTIGRIITLGGGFDNHFIYDGVEYNQVRGVAHFLEHYLIEKSIYGNIVNYFDNEYINTNGETYNMRTSYFISTVHDFEENFIKLLNVVNNPQFDEEKIKEVKNPIIREISRAKDDPDLAFRKYVNEIINNNLKTDVTLGEEEDILNMTIDDIKLFHEAFYQPSNQIIVISGKIDEERIIKIIEDEYKKLNKEHGELIRDDYIEDVSLPGKEGTFIDKDKHETLSLFYKMDVSSFTAKEKFLLDFFVGYLFTNNISEKSGFFSVIKEKELSIYSASYDGYYAADNNIFMMYVGLTTNKFDEAKELLTDKIANLKYDEKSFKIYINNSLIDLINDMENIHNTCSSFTSLLFGIKYEHVVTIDDIKSIDYKECLELFNKLDLSNYCVIKRIKGE